MWYDTPGDVLILFALTANGLAAMAFYLVSRGRVTFESLAIRSYSTFAVLVGLAVVYLYYLFFSHNYAFRYVYEYSQKGQSFFYILSAFWGGQEGTYLLWLFLNALFGFIIIRRGGRYRNTGMVVYSVVNLFFLLILTRLSPFALMSFHATDGLGLNPLLRDPWMVVHPPVIFAGYAMAAVPFTIVMAALLCHEYAHVPRLVFPWVAITALLLAGGNILGGYWAYKTLGWGGYWSWDPVENSSLIPWLISLAVLHGLIIEKRSGALRKTNLLLTSFVFVLVVYGTFLTRSGVLSDFSVHSFTDLGANFYLLGFLVLVVVITTSVFGYRARSIPSGSLDYNYFGKEFSLFAGMIMLFIVGVVVLFWSSLPLITTVLTNQPRAAVPATYNSFGLPLAIIMTFMLTVSPWVGFSPYELKHRRYKLLIVPVTSLAIGFAVFYYLLNSGFMFPVILVPVVTGLAAYLFHPGLRKRLLFPLVVAAGTVVAAMAFGVRSYDHVLFLGFAAMAAVSNLAFIVSRMPSKWCLIGGQLAHLGFGLMLIGVLVSSAYVSRERMILAAGESQSAFGLNITYRGVENDIRAVSNRLILAVRDGVRESEARPEMYYSERIDGIMRKPHIERSLLTDLYLAPEQILQETDAASMTLSKGESGTAGDFTVRFIGFSMEGHGDDADGHMSAAALLEISDADTVFEVRPSLSGAPGADGEPSLVKRPATFFLGGREYHIAVERILADDGAVVLRIPELSEGVPSEQLVMEISRIPLINLVWVGTSLILLGTLIVFFRRRDELRGDNQCDD